MVNIIDVNEQFHRSLYGVEIKGQHYVVRPANSENDLDWAYQLFKSSIGFYVTQALGEWPEKE